KHPPPSLSIMRMTSSSEQGLSMDRNLFERGLAKRRQVLGDAYVDRALENLDDFNRDFQRLATEYCWGEVWGDETLSPRERSILTLGMVAALGKMGEFANQVGASRTSCSAISSALT